MRASHLYKPLNIKQEYYDKHSNLSREDYKFKLANSTTLYVGKDLFN
jgi:hypothetical protein